MDSKLPLPEDLTDLTIECLGQARIPSPLKKSAQHYVSDDDKISVYQNYNKVQKYLAKNEQPPYFELAGARKLIQFNPKKLTCGIVTCGGLCPGLNDVIRTIVLGLKWQYKVKHVLGFHYGFEGLTAKMHLEPLEMTPAVVDQIQHEGGTILGSSRGQQNIKEMIRTLKKYDLKVLFVIGGDGTLKGAHALVQEIKNQKLKISIVAIPKTIDNDIYCVQRTFGFHTAVEEAIKAIYAAHEEAKAAWHGIGLVKLMGRDTGFIAVNATLANSDVNFCLIPEDAFRLKGKNGLLNLLNRRLKKRRHAVVVVAEGAGQELIKGSPKQKKDRSGNIKRNDIGLFLKQEIEEYFTKKKIPITLKYIDPSYMIRSGPANADDSTFCLLLGQNAVHAAMSGRTNMIISYWNQHFVHVPLSVAIRRKKEIDPHSDLWQTLLETTRQPGRCYL